MFDVIFDLNKLKINFPDFRNVCKKNTPENSVRSLKILHHTLPLLLDTHSTVCIVVNIKTQRVIHFTGHAKFIGKTIEKCLGKTWCLYSDIISQVTLHKQNTYVNFELNGIKYKLFAYPVWNSINEIFAVSFIKMAYSDIENISENLSASEI